MSTALKDSTELTSNSPEPVVSGRKRLVFRLVLLGFMLAIGAAFGELALRLVAPQPPSWLDVYRPHPKLNTYSLQPNVQRFIDTGECRWTVRSDSDGYRVSNHAPSTGAPVVLCLGDSYAFGYGVDHEDSYVGRLQSQAGNTLRFVNAAVPGYGPVQYEEMLDYVMERGVRPAHVLIGTYVGNDFHDSVWRKDGEVRDGVIGNRGDLRSFIKMNSHLYRLFSKAYHQVSLGDDEAYRFQQAMSVAANWNSGVLQKARSEYARRFAAMADRCRREGIPLSVILIPPRMSVVEAASSTSDLTEDSPGLPVAHARQVFIDLGIPFVDLTSALARHSINDVYFRHDGHFTPLGHRIASEAAARLLANGSSMEVATLPNEGL